MTNINTIPPKPGVYLYRDKAGKIIYIGKAINLKKRVSQYFQRDDALGPKTQTLVSQIAKIDYRLVNSEIEALILEASLIKQYRPKYNSQLTDDKNYLYICLTKEKLPRIFPTHQNNIPANSLVYGPFPDVSAVRSLLKIIRRLFPFYSQNNHPKTPCLYCHLHLCPGPNPDPKIYLQNITRIKKILSGKFKLLQRQLKKDMKTASKLEQYESALQIRHQLESIDYIVSGWHQLSQFYQSVNLPQDKVTSATNQLYTFLRPYFPILHLRRIECFDISNLSSNYFVGSMVVFQNGQIDKSQYRQFKIRSKSIPDDQFMLREVVWRRLKHPEWSLPDLIVVDGGKPQVSSLLQITKTPLIGLAKKQETIVIKHNSAWREINLPQNSQALKLLQQLRNEAHRFANAYRKKLIKKDIINP
jgi:excinuclease ABC subunit C